MELKSWKIIVAYGVDLVVQSMHLLHPLEAMKLTAHTTLSRLSDTNLKTFEKQNLEYCTVDKLFGVTIMLPIGEH